MVGPIVQVNGCGELLLIGGRFAFSSTDGPSLVAGMPALLVVRYDKKNAHVLQWALKQLAEELDQARPGGTLLAEHLAHIMLVHMLRIYLTDGQKGGPGWLRGLGDPRLYRALSAIHNEPGRSRSLAGLAREAALSRTGFAQRFKQAVGRTPIEYLTT